ncbi:MAG TPA: tetratricopeptide repeat protein [Flavitalea sp.]|nr:tetratricopeptide repeat protein [Flavitalea sp.]
MNIHRCILALCCISFLSAGAQTDSAAIYFEKGKEEKTARRFREAEKRFVKAISLAPDNLDYYLELADTYNAQNRYFEAKETFLKAEKLQPSNPVVIENLATLSFNTRKWADAIRYSKKVQELKLNKPVNFIIGNSYYQQENYGEAIKYLTEAAKEEPKKGEIPYTIARSYLDMSNYKLSAANFEKAISLDSSKVTWIYEAGLVYYAIPDYKKSLYYIQLAGDRGYTKSNDYLENLGNAYMNVGQHEKAVEVFRQILTRKPSDQEILYQIAQAYYKSGKYQLAIDYWDQVLTLDKTNARVLYMIGLSYQKKGEKQKGMQLCDKAIEMDPSLNSLKSKQGQLGL